jgi:hypothetical protein
MFTMTKSYRLHQVVRTIAVEVDKEAEAGREHIHFDFVIMVVSLAGGKYCLHVYRSDIYEMKTIGGEMCHEAILAKDLFLVDDLLRFDSESAAVSHLEKRLNELFG